MTFFLLAVKLICVKIHIQGIYLIQIYLEGMHYVTMIFNAVEANYMPINVAGLFILKEAWNSIVYYSIVY